MRCGAGRSLLGKEAERLADLGKRVSEEQQLFLKSMWTVPADASITYSYIDPRADAQLQVEVISFLLLVLSYLTSTAGSAYPSCALRCAQLGVST